MTSVASPSTPATIPQHSFGRSSRACATISSTSDWGILTAARLADGMGRRCGHHLTIGRPGRLGTIVDVEEARALAEDASTVRRRPVAPGEPDHGLEAPPSPVLQQQPEGTSKEGSLSVRSL